MEYEVNGELTSTDFTAYEAPSIERVGSVCGLTAGPVTKVSESSGGFHSSMAATPPRVEDDAD